MTSKTRGTHKDHEQGRKKYSPSSSKPRVPTLATINSPNTHMAPSPPPPQSLMPLSDHTYMPPPTLSLMPPPNHLYMPSPYPSYPGQSTFIPTPRYYEGYQHPLPPYLYPSMFPSMHYTSSSSSNNMHDASSTHRALSLCEQRDNHLLIEPIGDT